MVGRVNSIGDIENNIGHNVYFYKRPDRNNVECRTLVGIVYEPQGFIIDGEINSDDGIAFIPLDRSKVFWDEESCKEYGKRFEVD